LTKLLDNKILLKVFDKIERPWLDLTSDCSLLQLQFCSDLSPLERFRQEGHRDRPWDSIGEVRRLVGLYEDKASISETLNNDGDYRTHFAENGSAVENEKIKARL
jgi:hypothetical protein